MAGTGWAALGLLRDEWGCSYCSVSKGKVPQLSQGRDGDLGSDRSPSEAPRSQTQRISQQEVSAGAQTQNAPIFKGISGGGRDTDLSRAGSPCSLHHNIHSTQELQSVSI